MKQILILFLCLNVASSCYSQSRLLKQVVYAVTIGNKIKARLSLGRSGNVLIGEIQYSKGKTPIILRGKISGDKLDIYEFLKTGQISGIMSVKIVGSKITGEWRSPDSDKTLPISGMRTDVSNVVQPRVTQQPAIGTYFYSWGKAGDNGTLQVKAVNKDSVMLQFDNVTAAPAFNTATIDPVTVSMVKNQAIIMQSENCKISLIFVYDLVMVDYIDAHSQCGFGLNASVDGIYLKVSP